MHVLSIWTGKIGVVVFQLFENCLVLGMFSVSVFKVIRCKCSTAFIDLSRYTNRNKGLKCPLKRNVSWGFFYLAEYLVMLLVWVKNLCVMTVQATRIKYTVLAYAKITGNMQQNLDGCKHNQNFSCNINCNDNYVSEVFLDNVWSICWPPDFKWPHKYWKPQSSGLKYPD